MSRDIEKLQYELWLARERYLDSLMMELLALPNKIEDRFKERKHSDTGY